MEILGLGALILVGFAVLTFLQIRKSGAQSPIEDITPLKEQIARLGAERDGLQKSLESLRGDRDKAAASLTETQAAFGDLQSKLARTEQNLQNAEQLLERQEREFKEARDRMIADFKTASAESAKAQGESLKVQNKDQMELILKPLKDQIAKFEAELKTAHKHAGEERVALKTHIEMLGAASNSLADEAQALTRALRSDSQKQGAWGEMVLSRLLEASGLREGFEYTTQDSVTMDDNKRLRPDVVIKLPGDRTVVIDSKVSLNAFQDFENAETAEEAETHLKAHIMSVEKHVKDLASKDYLKAAGSKLDYVIMFVPIEGAWAAVHKERSDFHLWAMDRNIHVSPPSNLLPLLRTIKMIWDVERRYENADKIATSAAGLYDQFALFVDSFRMARKQIGSAISNMDKAEKQLVDGRGNVVRRLEQMRDMGVRPKKQLPDDLLNEAAEQDGGLLLGSEENE